MDSKVTKEFCWRIGMPSYKIRVMRVKAMNEPHTVTWWEIQRTGHWFGC